MNIRSDKLKTIEIFAIIIGAIIGMGSFMLPGTKFLPSAGVINTCLGLVLGTLMIVLIEKNYAYMMRQSITEGGEFSFTLNVLGKKHGFVVGWFLFLAYLTLIPLNASAMPIVVNFLFPDLLNFGYLYTIAGDPVYVGEILLSTAIMVVFAVINLLGVKNTGKTQTVIIYILIFAVVVTFFSMLFTSDLRQFNQNYIENYQFDFGGIAIVFALTPFLFIGFDAIPQLVNDLGVSKKKASTISVVALLCGMCIYILLNVSTAFAYSASDAVKLEWALGAGMMEKIGIVGFLITVLGLACAVSAGINGFMLCSMKLIGSMATEGVMPKSFAKKNSRGAGKFTIYFVTIVGTILCFFGRNVVVWIVDMCSFGAGVAYFYVSLCAFINSKDKKEKAFGLSGSIVSLFILLLLLLPFSPAVLSTPPLIILGVWTVLGFAIGVFIFRRKKN